MAVTINEMDVDVKGKSEQAQAPADSTAPKEPMDLRRETGRLAERELRLRAD
jgi:hypothetical protein